MVEPEHPQRSIRKQARLLHINRNRLKPRKVLSWEVSTTMDVTFCLSAWHKAIAAAGCAPEIMNTDQGSQFTSTARVDTVGLSGAQVSMDGKGRWIDNV
ncbi:MAG: putative transposase, partial [Candidatus Omnitrophota bacterium]